VPLVGKIDRYFNDPFAEMPVMIRAGKLAQAFSMWRDRRIKLLALSSVVTPWDLLTAAGRIE
jgi:hypothetical protein